MKIDEATLSYLVTGGVIVAFVAPLGFLLYYYIKDIINFKYTPRLPEVKPGKKSDPRELEEELSYEE